jgi:hypothetical protein
MAQQMPKPEDMIKIRKAGMSFQAWNMSRIKANIDGNFNKERGGCRQRGGRDGQLGHFRPVRAGDGQGRR